MNIDFSSHGVVVLIEKEGKYLLLKEARELLNGRWGPPHGRTIPEDDNNEVTTVIRETKEETGLAVSPIRKILTLPADTKVKTVSFWLAKLESESGLLIDSEEASEYGWFDVEEALQLELYPGTKLLFEKVKNGEISLS